MYLLRIPKFLFSFVTDVKQRIPGTCQDPYQIQCGNGTCISLSKQRDCVQDCNDDIDEGNGNHTSFIIHSRTSEVHVFKVAIKVTLGVMDANALNQDWPNLNVS